MRILALETVGVSGSVALLDQGQVLVQCRLDPALRSARSLAPSMHEVLRQAGWRPAEVQLVAVAHGPGSFTGLRLGVVTAKVFAYAVGAEVLGVNSLEVIANRAAGEIGPLETVLDAQRQQLFAARFESDPQRLWREVAPTRVVDNDAWLCSLTPGTSVSGPGLAKLVDRLPPCVAVIDAALWHPDAATTGLVAERHFAAGRRDNVMALCPQYFRRSAAEEKRDSA